MTDAEKLLALEAIKQLKARYFRCMDTKDWAGFAGVFAPDAVMDMRGENRTGGNADDQYVAGAQKIADFVRSNVDPVTTVHHGHTPEITLTGPDSATGIWAMEDQLRWPEGGPLKTLSGWGHYHETYVRIDGRWYIKSTKLTRLRVDVT
jgi:hypothetical protein